jgi:hypothetical protein
MSFESLKKKLSKARIEELEQNHKSGGNRQEVPAGEYVVSVAKMEAAVKQGQNGPWEQLNIDFKILEGERENQHIFYNGSFNNKIDSGYRATAKLLSELTGGDVDEYTILDELEGGANSCADFIIDLYQAIQDEKLEYSIKLDIQEQTDINPNTGKPYKPNRFFSVLEVYGG